MSYDPDETLLLLKKIGIALSLLFVIVMAEVYLQKRRDEKNNRRDN